MSYPTVNKSFEIMRLFTINSIDKETVISIYTSLLFPTQSNFFSPYKLHPSAAH